MFAHDQAPASGEMSQGVCFIGQLMKVFVLSGAVKVHIMELVLVVLVSSTVWKIAVNAPEAPSGIGVGSSDSTRNAPVEVTVMPEETGE